MKQEKLTYLIARFADKTISAEEKAELFELLSTHDETELAEVGHISWLNENLPPLNMQGREEVIHQQVNAILSTDKMKPDDRSADSPFLTRTAHRVHFLRRWGWAAAVILLLGSAAYLWLQPSSKENLVIQPVPIKNDAAPGSNKAILTLSDGSNIVLDSAANGSLAQQGNMVIVKLADGRITYRPAGVGSQEVVMNTMSTPRGGQYQLTLPDGTKVWLNAASSITYPTAFVQSQRKVSVSGEAYLEVAKNKQQPFIVEVANHSSIEVLGTEFNVNSYADEASIRTTLIEGSVKITAGKENIVLKPGQQALIASANQQLTVVNKVDIEQTLAWKNGTFNFQDMNFQEAARQLERWYDVQVVYEGKIPDIQFKGDMDRGVQLSEILHVLAVWGIKARIEGKKLIVE